MTRPKATGTKPPDEVTLRLGDLAREMPELAETARVFGAILTHLRDADIGASPIRLTAAEVRERMGRGAPLLPGLELEIDPALMRDLMIRLARALTAAGIAPAADVRRALEDGTLDVAGLLPHVASGAREEVTAAAAKAGLEDGIVRSLAENSFKPALIAWSRQLAPLMAEVPWGSGACPVCGAAATLAELQGRSAEKHLRCGMCGADWRFPRIGCPWCGDADHAKQGFIREEGREDRRAETCDACHRYLKVVTCYYPASIEMVAVNDLATVRLDFAAQRRGYTRGEAV